jgi:[acyl-carrier-protein] S-malonyltransferase
MWAFLYPGQGSQHTGMGRFLFDNFPAAKICFEEASDAIKLDLKKLCFEGSDSDLALTENTQPAILTTSIATGRVLTELTGVRAQAAAGHSIGEYAACVMSDSIAFADAVRAVRRRGEAMQKAVPVGEGSMSAIMGLDQDEIEKLCKWATANSKLGPIEPANFNAPGQIVISGSAKTLAWLKDNLSSPEIAKIFTAEPKKIKLIPLSVSAPFHCSLMKPAEQVMKDVLESINFKEANHWVVQNFTAEPVKDPNLLRKNLVHQVSGSVKWTQCIEKLPQLQVQACIEVGAGRVLTGLMKKINPNLPIYCLNSLEDLKTLETKINSQSQSPSQH